MRTTRIICSYRNSSNWGLSALLYWYCCFCSSSRGFTAVCGRPPKRFRFLLGAIFGGFAGLLLQGLTDHLWFDYRIVLFFWCFIGIGMATVRVAEKKGERETEEMK